jgi:cytochrome c oxidase cbb3-type subunit 3
MFKDFLRSLEGIATYPTIALIIFFTVFVGVLLYVFLMDRKHADRMGALPLNGTKNLSHKRGTDG